MTVSVKKYMTVLAAAALVAVAVSACGGGGNGNDDPPTTTPTMPTTPTTPTDVDLSHVTPGFMAEAGTVRISAGQMRDHGDIEFSCAAGRYDCTVMVMVDSDGTVTATQTGGTVTATNSSMYNMQIRLANEANSIHASTSIDVVSPVFSPNTGSNYIGVAQQGRSAGRTARAIPWVDDAGDVHFWISVSSGLSESELDPLA